MNTIIVESHAVQRIRRHSATARRAPAMPAIAARKRATEALGRSAVVFLAGAAFALGAVLPLKAKAAPYEGEPVTVPATIKAVHFDRGGEGIGYHDRSDRNISGTFRASEGVDTIPTTVGHAVSNFQTGEWLAYSINVPATGDYSIELRASKIGRAHV